MQPNQPFKQQTPEQPRQDPYRQEEPRTAGDPPGAIRRQSTARDDDMDMGVVGHRRAPCVEHTGHADPSAKVLGVGRNSQQRLGRCLEQEAVDRRLVLIRDVRDLRWQGEDRVEVFDRQHVFDTRGHPLPRGGPLTLRAMPIAAGVVGDVLVAAFGAGRNMPAEGGGPASLNGGHYL